MFKYCMEKPIVLLVGILIICLFGLTSLFRVPLQMIPDLDPRIISVETRWPGATPQDIEQEIIIEQEEFLRGITGLERMDSTASFGRGVIELEFPFGVDISEALILVNNALSQVPNYPENVDEPRITADSYSSQSFMFTAVQYIDPERKGVGELQDWIEDTVKPQLERVPGIASVRIFGGQKRQVDIYLDPAELAARNLSIMDVRNAIRSRNRDVSGGDMDFGKRRYLLRTLGRFESIQQLNQLIIAEREGAFVRLQDVGSAKMSHEEIRSSSFSNGRPSVSLPLSKTPGSNVIEVKNRALEAIEQINTQLLNPRGLELNVYSEDARYVERSVNTVTLNLLIGALLASAVLLLFLRSVSATLIGSIGIPICILAAFLGLQLTGRSINVISLAGIAFAIGMTLDNSIVALENIARHLALGKTRFEAALDGIREVWPAILASTLTTVMVFLPVIFLGMEAGQLYSDIAVAISASILMSMLVAITLIPAASGRLLNISNIASLEQRDAPIERLLHRTTQWGESTAKRILSASSWLLHTTRRQIGTVVVTCLTALLVLFFLVPAAEYLPEGEEAKIFARMMAPPGYNIQTLIDIQSGLDPVFVAEMHAPEERYQSGETDIPPLIQHFSSVRAGFMMYITEPAEAKHTPELIAVTSEKFREVPGMRSFATRGSIFSDNRGGTRSINIELSGRNLEQLYTTALRVFNQADSLFEGGQLNSTPPPTNLKMSQPIARVIPDWERAAELDIGQDELGYMIWAYSDGAFVDEFFLDDDKIDMYLFAKEGAVSRPSDLENLTLYSSSGQQIPVSVLAKVEETVGAANVSRVDGLRTVTIQILPPRSIALEDAVKQVQQEFLPKLRAQQLIPAEINASITGATSQLQKTQAAMAGNFLMAVCIAYLLLVAVFSHWGFPLIIMTTVPIGISGGVVGLLLFNLVSDNLDLIGLEPYLQPFDVITMLGFLILIGTVVNNPILIVERSVSNIKAKGMAIREAIEDAVRIRLRPVMMSTITTVCGLSPLVFLPGEGSELYRGLGAIVLSGLLFSSVVTLTILPALIALLFELRERIVSKGGRIDSSI